MAQSGRKRTSILAFNRSHCSPGGLESVPTDAVISRALKGEAWGQSILSFSPQLKCTGHQYIILENLLPIYFLVKIKTYKFPLFLRVSVLLRNVSVLVKTNISFVSLL